MKLSKVLDAIKEELKQPLPSPRVVSPKAKKERKMAKKSKPEVDEEELDEEEDETEDEDDEEEAPKAKAKKPSKGVSVKKSKAKPKADSNEGYVTLQDLADEAEIEAQSARVKLRESDLDKPEGGRWRWKDGSKDLKAARKVLGL